MIRYTTHSLLDTRVAVSATVPSALKTERAIALGLWRGPREDDVGVGAVSAGLAWQPAEPPRAHEDDDDDADADDEVEGEEEEKRVEVRMDEWGVPVQVAVARIEKRAAVYDNDFIYVCVNCACPCPCASGGGAGNVLSCKFHTVNRELLVRLCEGFPASDVKTRFWHLQVGRDSAPDGGTAYRDSVERVVRTCFPLFSTWLHMGGPLPETISSTNGDTHSEQDVSAAVTATASVSASASAPLLTLCHFYVFGVLIRSPLFVVAARDALDAMTAREHSRLYSSITFFTAGSLLGSAVQYVYDSPVPLPLGENLNALRSAVMKHVVATTGAWVLDAFEWPDDARKELGDLLWSGCKGFIQGTCAAGSIDLAPATTTTTTTTSAGPAIPKPAAPPPADGSGKCNIGSTKEARKSRPEVMEEQQDVEEETCGRDTDIPVPSAGKQQSARRIDLAQDHPIISDELADLCQQYELFQPGVVGL